MAGMVKLQILLFRVEVQGGLSGFQSGSVVGGGVIQANGGQGGGNAYGDGGGGAGGRIVIDSLNGSFIGEIQAYGGEKGGDDAQSGGPGTIYWTEEDYLLIDGHGRDDQPAGLISDDYDFSTTNLINYGNLEILGETSTFSMTNIITGDGSGTLTSFGTLIAPSVFTITNVTVDVQGQLSDPDQLVIGNDGGLILRASTPLHTGSFEYASIQVGGGGTLTLVPYDNGNTEYTDDAPFELVVDTLLIETGGVINTDGLGYKGTNGDGAGPGGGGGIPASVTNSYKSGGGGGYGGKGGDSSYPGGISYGQAQSPSDLGSAGGAGINQTTVVKGADGGGAYRIVANDSIVVNGEMSANGAIGKDYERIVNISSGGGSGGSIWILTPVLSGSGTIQANGGDSHYGGSGGGGRIAVEVTDIDPGITFSVEPGDASSEDKRGEAGSVVKPYYYTAWLSPEAITLNQGGSAAVGVGVSNDGFLSDVYTFYRFGIEPDLD